MAAAHHELEKDISTKEEEGGVVGFERKVYSTRWLVLVAAAISNLGAGMVGISFFS